MFVITLIVLIGLALVLSAQPCEPYPGFHSRSPNREIVRQYRSLELLKTLNLSEEQSNRILPIISDIESAREEYFTQYQSKLDELAEALKQEKPSEKELRKLNNEILELQRIHCETLNEDMQRLASELTQEQFARYLLFENRFQLRLRKRISEYHEKREMPSNTSNTCDTCDTCDTCNN